MNSEMKSFLFADSNAIPWRKSTFAESVYAKDLRFSDGQAIQLVRYEPDGRGYSAGRRLGPGCAGVAPAGRAEDAFGHQSSVTG